MSGNGPFETIRKYKSTWQAERRAAMAPETPDLPKALTQGLAAFGRDVWLQAPAGADLCVVAEREAISEARVSMEREIDEATALADRLDSALGEAQINIDRLEAAAMDASQRMAALERELAAEAAMRHQLEAQATQREQAFRALQG